ncbi:MAG: single-stranded-DNA-specific exonuclease RecJ [Bacteriovoracaceae bacterium]|nr:single-stranded-DNA-specific exonuclease RecJ [Bacteriovoracaceae bacterium]
MTQLGSQQESFTLLAPIRRLFEKRQFSHEQVKEFFSFNLSELPKLTKMNDMDKAALRIIEAIENNEQIGIYGDYDVDGTTSCALLYHFFKMLKVDVSLFQPSRFIEGYGIHPSSIDKALENNVKLLITVDCGITNVEAAEYAQLRGLDLIITDHHKDAAEVLPPAYAVVNPNRRDEDKNSGLGVLAGVGVAFALAVRVRELLIEKKQNVPSIYPLLQFVAIGTICDMARLSTLNLRLSRHGLMQMPNSQYPGILAFIPPEERTVAILPSDKISFNIGPLINSKGRLDHPERALNVLTAMDSTVARENLAHLEISNRERKFIQGEVFNHAKKIVIENMKHQFNPINIVYSPEWHEGVIGIVASKLVETFEIPAIVFTNAEEHGVIKASARTAGQFNIFDALKSCEDLFLKFGGHHSAAGLSMKKENLSEFEKRMNQYLKNVPEIARTVQDHFDIELDFNEVSAELVKQIELLEPFGNYNTRPVFRMKNVKIHSFRIMKDQHVRWDIVQKNNDQKRLQGISFFYVGKWNQPTPEDIFSRQENEDITIQFSLGINRFNGKEYIQLMVDKIFIGLVH